AAPASVPTLCPTRAALPLVHFRSEHRSKRSARRCRGPEASLAGFRTVSPLACAHLARRPTRTAVAHLGDGCGRLLQRRALELSAERDQAPGRVLSVDGEVDVRGAGVRVAKHALQRIA